MRWLIALPLLLSGCVIGAIQDSGRDCPAGTPGEDGFRVTVPEVVAGDGAEARTHGYCVSMRPGGEVLPETRRSVREGEAWFPVTVAGTYRFSLSIREPGDPSCAFWLEAEEEHGGSGVVDVELAYEGVSVCD